MLAGESRGAPKVDRRRRWSKRVLVALTLLVVGGLIGWSIKAVFIAPADVLDSDAFTFVEVVTDEVGSTVNLNAVAEWKSVPVGANLAQGIVTSIPVQRGQSIDVGVTLYTVNLRPTVVAVGEIPSFRSMSTGSTGADVAQLQRMLRTLNLYAGADDGLFGRLTAAGVKAWQRGLGVQADGVVQASDIVFVPALPARVALGDEDFRVGASLTGGESLVSVLGSEPEFSIGVTDVQARTMPVGTQVVIDGPDGLVWLAEVSNQVPAGPETSGYSLALTGPDGGSICGDACDALPVSGPTTLASQVVVAAPIEGPVVPVAAIRSSPDGTLSVIDSDGLSHEVEIVATARGLAVVSGVSLGLRVRVPADAE